MASREAIQYQPFDGTDGFEMKKGVLRAYKDGAVVAETDISGVADLDQMLRTYQIPYLFPSLIFCYGKPSWHEVSLDYAGVDKEKREIRGDLVFEGSAYPWFARLTEHPDFALADALPNGARPWIRPSESERGVGLEFHLPVSVASHPDPVVVRRLALALEELVYALQDPRFKIQLPRARAFDNFFSIDTPMWAVNLPRIVATQFGENFEDFLS